MLSNEYPYTTRALCELVVVPLAYHFLPLIVNGTQVGQYSASDLLHPKLCANWILVNPNSRSLIPMILQQKEIRKMGSSTPVLFNQLCDRFCCPVTVPRNHRATLFLKGARYKGTASRHLLAQRVPIAP